MNIPGAAFNYLGEELYLWLMRYGHLYATALCVLLLLASRRRPR